MLPVCGNAGQLSNTEPLNQYQVENTVVFHGFWIHKVGLNLQLHKSSC